MSEALGKDDIEDVVSSVRRLVSPEARPRAVSRDLGFDKLLLTPALQVTPDVPRPATLILTERAAEVEAALNKAPIPLPAGPQADPLPDVVVADDVQEAPQEAALSAPMAEDEIFAEIITENLKASQGAPAGPDLALHVVDGEWEDAFWSEPEPALAELALGVEEAELVPADPAPWAQSESDWPEAEGGPDAAVSASRLTSSAGFADLTDADGNPVTVLDEAALNDIVRALIREELQGVLGERITHNVRKLVRAEVNRALTARSMD